MGKRIRRGENISAAYLNELATSAEQQGRLNAAAPFSVRHGAGGDQVLAPPDGRFYALLTGRSGTAYAWSEVYFDPVSLTWQLLPSGRSGTTGFLPAYEYNLATDVPASGSGAIVRLKPGAEAPFDYRFIFDRAGVVAPVGCSPCQPPLSALTLTIRYWDNSVHPVIVSQTATMSYRSGVSANGSLQPTDHNVWNTACLDFLATANSGDPILGQSRWIFEMFCNHGTLFLIGYGYLLTAFCDSTSAHPCCPQYPTLIPNLSSVPPSEYSSITGFATPGTGFTPTLTYDLAGSTCSPLYQRWTGNRQSGATFPWLVDIVISP